MENNTPKKLYKSNQNKMIAGVCGGLGEYFNIDPTLVRLGCVALGIFGGGILAYIVAAIIIPEPTTEAEAAPNEAQATSSATESAASAPTGDTATSNVDSDRDTPTML